MFPVVLGLRANEISAASPCIIQLRAAGPHRTSPPPMSLAHGLGTANQAEGPTSGGGEFRQTGGGQRNGGGAGRTPMLGGPAAP